MRALHAAPAPAAAPRVAAAARPRARPATQRRAAAGAGGAPAALVELPASTDAQVAQCRAAVQSAVEAGVTRQRLLLTLPLIGATDLDDWPGGIRQMWSAAKPMISTLLQGLQSRSGAAASVAQRVLDDADAVVELSTPLFTAVVFPTADTLPEMKKLDASCKGTLLMCNTAWNTEGANLIDDLGFGPWRQANVDFIARFEETYSLKEYRIRGQTMRVLRAYPGPWQTFVLDGRGGVERIATQEAKPVFADLERALSAMGSRSIANADWATRLRSEIYFNVESAKPPPPQE